MDQISAGELFQHYKGKRYKILAVGRHSEDLEPYVVYQGQYLCESFGDKPVWVRPLKMFFESVEYNGQQMQRFTKCS